MESQKNIINKLNDKAIYTAISNDLGEKVLKIDLLSKFTGGMRNEVWKIQARSKNQRKDYVLKSHASLIDDRGFSKFKNEVYSLKYIYNSTGLAPKILYFSEIKTMILMDFIAGETMQNKSNSMKNQLGLKKTVDMFAKIHSLNESMPHSYLFHRDPADLIEAISLVEQYVTFSIPFLVCIKKYADTIIDTLKNESNTFILGDGNPTNLIFSDNNRLFVIDTELASLGNPSLDISQFLLYSNLKLSEKSWIIHQYCASMNLDTAEFTQLVDYNTLFIGLLTVGIYARELSAACSERSTRQNIVKQERMNKFIYACSHLLSDNALSEEINSFVGIK